MKTLLLTVLLAVCQAAPTVDLTNLYEIDIETKPEDGKVTGIRIRRSEEGKKSAEELPEVDIENIDEETFGIRVRRSGLKDLSDIELDKELDNEQEETAERSRRSGGELFSIIGSKIKQKLSAIAGASSGHNSEAHETITYGPPVTSYDDKQFDIWAFKKAILNTLFQAVKAIKGGVIALGGQLIKAKGHLVSTAGRIVATKGEAISGFGRHIAANALLTPPAHSHATAYAEAAVDHSGYGTGTGPSNSGYSYPSANLPSYTTQDLSNYAHAGGYTKRGANQQQFGIPQELPNGVQAGLLVLKPITVPDGQKRPLTVPHQNFNPRDLHSSHTSIESVVVNHVGTEVETAGQQPGDAKTNDAQSRSYFVRYL